MEIATAHTDLRTDGTGEEMQQGRSGFTLIELSIVLVVIGLLAGSVLVGLDLIRAAEVRATITQIEKFNTAVNTFYSKYGYLPGDINAQAAAQFGFTPRGSWLGQGDGNGLVEGYDGVAIGGCGICKVMGETTMFWVDLTIANGLNINLIEGGFNKAQVGATFSAGATLNTVFPQAKLDQGNCFYVWSGGSGENNNYMSSGVEYFQSNGTNYHGLSAISALPTVASGFLKSTTGLTVQQAYNIDKKMDDGLPQSGRVTAMYLNNLVEWAAGANTMGSGGSASGASPGAAQTPQTWTCYDNGGNASAPMQYSLGTNNGNGVNCALSFQFQ
jgi:prepilin-type N-terminal cleavage/methylation domain-containing protein